MPTWIETVGITALWVVALARAPHLRNREQRPLCFAIIMIALAMSTHLDPVTEFLAHVVPDAHWIDMTTHLFAIVDASAVLWFILGAAGRQRHTGLVFSAAVSVMTTLVLLDQGAPAHTRNIIAPSASTPGVPDAYWWIFFSFHLIADTTCWLVCWSYGRRQDTPRLLRYGLRLFGTGMLLADVLWVLKLVYLQTRSTDIAPLFSPVTGVEALFMAVGVALPVVTQVRERRRDGRSYRQLAPLWRDLTAANPDVVLAPDSGVRSLVIPLQLRLYRRVIEIRDAMIVLRNYVTPSALDLAHRHVTDQGVPGHLSDAHLTACWLTAALRAKNDGVVPQSQTANLAGPGANDLADEIDHLLQVADAYRSPAVHAYRSSLGTA